MKRDKFIKRCTLWSVVTYILAVVSGIVAFGSAMCIMNGRLGAIWVLAVCILLTCVFAGLHDALERRMKNATDRRRLADQAHKGAI